MTLQTINRYQIQTELGRGLLQSALIRFSILSLLMALFSFSALFLAPMNAPARRDDASLTSHPVMLHASSDYFGSSVALSGEFVLVGAPQDDDNLLGQEVGAAYLYDLSPGSVPDISLSPSSMMSIGIEGTSSSTETLTIGNNGTEALAWNISGADEPWLTVSPLSGTLAANEEGLITLEFDPIALTADYYTETLTITSNDPDEAELTVPLLFKVMRRTTELKLTPSDGEPYDAFGWAVSLDGEQALIGTLEDNELGSAYFYRFDGSRWVEEAKLTASDGKGWLWRSSFSFW